MENCQSQELGLVKAIKDQQYSSGIKTKAIKETSAGLQLEWYTD